MLITLATQRTSHLIGAGAQVPQALTDGFRLAYLIGAGLCAAAAADRFRRCRARRRSPARRCAAMAPAIASRSSIRAFVALDFAFGEPHGAPIGAYTTATPTASSPRRRCTRRRSSTDEPTSVDQLAPGYIFTANFYDLNYPPIVGPERPADPRLAPAAGLVSAGADQTWSPAT